MSSPARVTVAVGQKSGAGVEVRMGADSPEWQTSVARPGYLTLGLVWAAPMDLLVPRCGRCCRAVVDQRPGTRSTHLRPMRTMRECQEQTSTLARRKAGAAFPNAHALHRFLLLKGGADATRDIRHQGG